MKKFLIVDQGAIFWNRFLQVVCRNLKCRPTGEGWEEWCPQPASRGQYSVEYNTNAQEVPNEDYIRYGVRVPRLEEMPLIFVVNPDGSVEEQTNITAEQAGEFINARISDAWRMENLWHGNQTRTAVAIEQTLAVVLYNGTQMYDKRIREIYRNVGLTVVEQFRFCANNEQAYRLCHGAVVETRFWGVCYDLGLGPNLGIVLRGENAGGAAAGLDMRGMSNLVWSAFSEDCAYQKWRIAKECPSPYGGVLWA